jgi:hypothetical protein
MQKNMKTSVHQAKLGKPPWMADIIELMKAIIQASCRSPLVCQPYRLMCRCTNNADRDGRKREGIAHDAADRKLRPPVIAVSVFHFAQRWGSKGAVRGHRVSRRERGGLDVLVAGKGAWCRVKDRLSTGELLRDACRDEQ